MSDRVGRGMVMVLAGVFLFACLDAVTKHLALRYGAPMILTIRYAVAIPVLCLILLPRAGRSALRMRRPWLTLLRSAAIGTGSLFAAAAYARMPVAEATSITYLSPVAVLLLSGLVLGEKVSLLAWLSAAGGLAGLLLVTRPENDLPLYGVLFALGTAAMTTLYLLLTRLLTRGDDTLSLLLHANLVGAALSLALLPFSLPSQMPAAMDVAMIAASGLASLAGHFLITAAYREAEAYRLAPLNYFQLLWAGLIGWIAFNHIPDPMALAGMVLIAASGCALPIWHRVGKGRAAARVRNTPDAAP